MNGSKSNTFYNEFDTETLGYRREDYRTEFEKDRDRIIHSSAFRRLQAKTQVFLSGEYDFYRTRLTHSIEVSQIGRSICSHLLRSGQPLSDTFFIDPALVEAACLAHDIGHPPFGHAGERTLNDLMKAKGGFEGNAQTLRILAETFYSDQGMKPTRALVDAVLKYKMLWKGSKKEKHFVYDEQAEILDWVFRDSNYLGESDFTEDKNEFRSIECQIMDWADDTAYSINDVADGVKAGFISAKRIRDWASERELDDFGQATVDQLADAISANIERFLSIKIGQFIQACSLVPASNFLNDRTNRYAFDLEIDEFSKRQSELYKAIALELVFRAPQVVQLEAKGDFMLQRLFEKMHENYSRDKPEHLIPSSVHDAIASKQSDEEKARLLCDYIAGMTDHHATRIYRRFFDPNFGSLADLV